MRGKAVLKGAGIAVAALVLVSVLAFGWVKLAPRRVPAGQPPLATVDTGSLGAFREGFNAGAGEVRVLALLSPT